MLVPNRGGRPAGSQNKLTIIQRKVAGFVCYGPDGETPDSVQEFAAQQRKEFLDGTMHPTVKLYWLYCLLGKPTEHIELTTNPDEFVGLSPDELRERIARLAEEARELQTIDVSPSKQPLEMNP